MLDDDDDDDEAVYSLDDIMEFCAAGWLISTGHVPPDADRPEEMTLAEWAKDHVSAAVFADAVQRAKAMSPDERGMHMAAALGDHDA